MCCNVFHFSIGNSCLLTAAALVLAGCLRHSYPSYRYKKAGYQFIEVLKHIETHYVDTPCLLELEEKAIQNMLPLLDPYTRYIPASQVAQYSDAINGTLQGIGITFYISTQGIPQVIGTIQNSAAYQAGIRPGDKIIEIEGQSVTKLSVQDIRNIINGSKKPRLHFVIQRPPSTLLTVALSPTKLTLPSIEASYMLDWQTGYIKVTQFLPHTAKEFSEAIQVLKKTGMKRLVLDLQDNPGGYLEATIHFLEELIPENTLLLHTQGRTENTNKEYYTKRKGSFEKGPLLVLLNEGSASAAEVVAGVLQDHDRALIVGRSSSGKGLIQIPLFLKGGSQLYLTVARYLLPSGRSIQKKYSSLIEASPPPSRGDISNNNFLPPFPFKTSKGRPLASSQGIVPDYEVPASAMAHSSYYLKKLLSVNILYSYVFDEYIAHHRQELEAISYQDYYLHFEVGEDILESFITKALQGEKFHEAKIGEAEKNSVKGLLKAFIAVGIWGQEAFYPIYHQHDPMIQKAITLFHSVEVQAFFN